jgi:hypothetical protein
MEQSSFDRCFVYALVPSSWENFDGVPVAWRWWEGDFSDQCLFLVDGHGDLSLRPFQGGGDG